MEDERLQQTEGPRMVPARDILQGQKKVPPGGSWARTEFMVIDTETTGADPDQDQVVELGAALFDGATLRRRYCQRVRAARPIHPDASRVHGIRDEDLADKPTFGELAPRLVQHLDRVVYLVGYNALSFDVPLLNGEFLRAGHLSRIDPDRVLDVIVWVRWHLRHIPMRKLGEVCALCNVPLGRAHSAGADAEATGRLLLHLVAEGIIPEEPYAALAQQADLQQRLQVEWDRWAYWLYTDRKDGQTLRMGCGKHVNLPFDRVDPGYCAFMLDKVSDLPAEVRQLFQARAKGGERQGGVHLAVPHG